MNTTKKKIIAAVIIGAFLLTPILLLKTIFYANLLYIGLSLFVWLVILLLEKIEDLKGKYQDPKNGLFSAIVKTLFILGVLMQYTFFYWVFNKNSEITFKKEALKQIAKHQDRIDELVNYSIFRR